MHDAEHSPNTLTRLTPDAETNPGTDAEATPEQAALFPAPGRWQRLRARLQRFAPRHIPIVYKITLSISVLMVACIGLLAAVIVQNQTQVLRGQIDDLANTLATQDAHSALEPLLADDHLALGVLATNLTARSGSCPTAARPGGEKPASGNSNRPGSILARCTDHQRRCRHIEQLKEADMGMRKVAVVGAGMTKFVRRALETPKTGLGSSPAWRCSPAS